MYFCPVIISVDDLVGVSFVIIGLVYMLLKTRPQSLYFSG